MKLSCTRSQSKESKFTDENLGSATSAEGLFIKRIFAEKDELKEELKILT